MTSDVPSSSGAAGLPTPPSARRSAAAATSASTAAPAPASQKPADVPSAAIAPRAAGAVVAAKKPTTLQDHLTGPKFSAEIAKALPKHLPPERFIRVAITAMTKTPKLKECEPASFFKALLDLSAAGLEPDGRRAHLIPFNNNKRGVVECQLIIDYKGLAELVYRSGVVSYLHADVVRDGDIFEFSAGELRSHVPHFLRRDADRPEKAGEAFAVYALARFKDGSTKCEVMSMDEVDAIRKRSKAANSGPWVTDYLEMAKKTAFRRLTKWLPLSPEIMSVLDKDADVPADIGTMKRTVPVAGSSMADALGAASSEDPSVDVAEDDVHMGDEAEDGGEDAAQ